MGHTISAASIIALVCGIILLSFGCIVLAGEIEMIMEDGPTDMGMAFIALLFLGASFALYQGIRSIKQDRRGETKARRKPFPQWIKDSTLQLQDGKCNMCSMPLNSLVVEYDHKDGDRSNAQLSNCQALCANCHSEKTKIGS